MSQGNYVIENLAGAGFRAAVNAVLAAIATNNSGAAEPTVTYAHQWWADTSANILKRRNAGNTAWISVMSLSLAISTFAETFLAASDVAAARATLGAVAADGSVRMTGDLGFAAGKGVVLEGATEDSFETTFLATDPTADRTLLLPDKNGVLATLDDVSAGVYVPVRQTVLSGPVDSNGFAAFGGAAGGTTVTASGTLIVTAANGFNINGEVNRIGSITNPSWSGLSVNGPMYLYLDIAANGTCTPGKTSVKPTYQWGGADVVTNDQFTYNIQESVGKVGNGTTAAQAYRVFVGEVLIAGGVVSAAPGSITWYALRGKYKSALVPVPAASTRIAFSHNIGVDPGLLTAKTWARFLAPGIGYTAGMVVPAMNSYTGSYANFIMAESLETHLAASYIAGNAGTAAVDRSTSIWANIPVGSGTAQLFMVVERGW